MNDSYILRVTWDEVDDYLNKVVSLVSSKEYSGVYGIPRGGSVLAAWLSHKLYLPLQSNPDNQSIIIDDISNSGTDLVNCKVEFELTGEKYFVTTMYKGIDVPEGLIHYNHREKGERWIAFPWEQ